MAEPTEDQLLDYFRRDLIAHHGMAYPELEQRARRRLDLYLAMRSAAVKDLLASFPPLSEDQRRSVTALLSD